VDQDLQGALWMLSFEHNFQLSAFVVTPDKEAKPCSHNWWDDEITCETNKKQQQQQKQKIKNKKQKTKKQKKQKNQKKQK
jgi:hypothetical protein